MMVHLSGQFPVLPLHEYVRFYAKIGEILAILRPYHCVGVEKIRVGGQHDGGYVMLPPDANAIAYSLGVSDYSPWDWVMAQNGIPVYQYDGTIERAPNEHANLFFHRYNIAAPSQATPDTKTLPQIFTDLGHEQHNNLILQIDIEGAEWAVFDELSEADLMKFKQIIIEWHGLSPAVAGLDKRLSILRKVARTHTPIHVHINNYGLPYSAEKGLLCYGDAYEVSYVRSQDYELTPSHDHYPTALDAPCNPNSPDILIGQWTD